VANKFKRYSKRFINASLYIYSTPKYNANVVSNKTKHDVTKAKVSIQNTK
jgi:hypothetical protein